MSWDDIDDILYDGTTAEIQNVKCPECGGEISYEYSDESRSFSIVCKKCGHISRASGGPIPNCVKFFGSKATLPRIEQSKAI